MMNLPGFEAYLNQSSAPNPRASPCGRAECMTLPISTNNKKEKEASSRYQQNQQSFRLEHGTSAHEEAMTLGANIARIEPESVLSQHKCALVEAGHNLDITNVLPIHVAVFCGNIESVRAFIEEHGVDYVRDLRIDHDRSVIEFAARGGHLSIIKMFHEEYKVDCDTTNAKGASPASIAAQEDFADILRYLVDVVGSDPHRLTKRNRNLISYTLGFSCNIKLTQWLHETHKVEIPENDNDRLLCCVCDDLRRNAIKNWPVFKYCFEVLKIKVPEGGTYPPVPEDATEDERKDAPGIDCIPPLCCVSIISLEQDQIRKAQLEIQENAVNNTFGKDDDNNNGDNIDEMILDAETIAIKAIDLILDVCPNVEVESWAGLTALHAAASAGNFRVVKHLIENKKAVPRTTRVGSPLHHACMSLNADLLKYLIEDCKIDPNVCVPKTEVQPIALLLPNFKPNRSIQQNLNESLNSNNSTGVKKDQDFLECVKVLYRGGCKHATFRVARDQCSGHLIQRKFAGSSLNIFSSFLMMLSGRSSSSSESSSSLEESSAEKRRRRLLNKNNNSNNKKDDPNLFVEIEDLNHVCSFPLSSICFCFDFGFTRMFEVQPPFHSFYNAAASVSNIGILRFADDLNCGAHPLDSLICPELALVGVEVGDSKQNAEQTRTSSSSSATTKSQKKEKILRGVLQLSGKNADGEISSVELSESLNKMIDDLSDSSDDDIVYEMIDEVCEAAQKSVVPNSTQEPSTFDKKVKALLEINKNRRKRNSRKKNNWFQSSKFPTNVVDAIAQFSTTQPHNYFFNQTNSNSNAVEFLLHAQNFPKYVQNSAEDPLAVATTKYLASRRSILGRHCGDKCNRNSSFTLDGLVGSLQMRVSDWIIGVLSRSGYLSNKNRWE